MNVTGLITKLNKIKESYPRAKVCINKRTFKHVLEEDGCVILDVKNIEVEAVCQLDGDGCVKENKNGLESYKTCVVLKGVKE